MRIRLSQSGDLPEIRAVYRSARAFMAANGNPDQWGDVYPYDELIVSDIGTVSYVVIDNDAVAGVFVLQENADEPAYREIDGAWLNDGPYGVIHRFAAGAARRGVGQCILDWCLARTGNIRVDTHADNAPMRGLLAKNGYAYCGVVSYPGYGERLGYQKTVNTDA